MSPDILSGEGPPGGLLEGSCRRRRRKKVVRSSDRRLAGLFQNVQRSFFPKAPGMARLIEEVFYDRGSPQFFWGSSLKEIHASPESWLQQKSNFIAVNNSMGRVYKTFYWNQDWHYSDDLGSRNPVFQKQNNSGNKCATSIVERVRVSKRNQHTITKKRLFRHY